MAGIIIFNFRNKYIHMKNKFKKKEKLGDVSRE